MTDDIDGYCGLPWCHKVLMRKASRGRPSLYCSEEHRREAQNVRRQTEAHIGRLDEQKRRAEHLLAALPGATEGDG